MSYGVRIKQSAVKATAGLPKADRARVDERIAALAENPRPTGCVKPSGQGDLWRIRVGDWRVVY